MRAPVRSAPAPPGLRASQPSTTNNASSRTSSVVSFKNGRTGGEVSSLFVTGGDRVTSRGNLSTATCSNVALLASLAHPTSCSQQQLKSVKKRAPPRPPPPKITPKVRDTPPTYEDVLREDAAATLEGLSAPVISRSATMPSIVRGDLMDFSSPDKTTSLSRHSVRSANDNDPWSSVASTSSSTSLSKQSTLVPTVIRPSKTSSAKPADPSSFSSASHKLVSCSVRGDREYSPPMPTQPPPPPPPSIRQQSSLDWTFGEDIKDTVVPAVTPPVRTGSAMSNTSSAGVPCAVALFDYRSSEPGDLSFCAGQQILLTARPNNEWLEGSTMDGLNSGLFPECYVRVTVPLPDNTPQANNETVSCDGAAAESVTTGDSANCSSDGIRVMALYDFVATESDDLGFKSGDYVFVMGRLNSEWAYGSRRGQYGQFPVNFIDTDISSLPLL